MHKVHRIILALPMALVSLPALASVPATYMESSATAANSLPSSDQNITRRWLRMNPSTFAVSNAAVLEQYDRVARLDSRLNPEKRVRLATMLQANQGVSFVMPDGICLDWLTGRFEGSPFVYSGMCKALGRNDQGLMFDLGDGVTIYWFTGDEGRSCNNIGVVIKNPIVPGVPVVPPTPKKIVCQTVYSQRQSQPTEGVFISSLYLVDCCCDVLYTPSLYIPGGSPDTMTFAIQVCS